ncbi:ABC transporter ATP-binding protein [Candidatus Xianfuyuplasma coldseepsis]|uniref:ABC transporter ATP-binding protein n=1 Tax=Candidatus Xianfuyuplasma coldseepsis TaxID=2782163 RepID=A0A7L7KTU8_9MOLU|nr:ABC transporter ATP-binding protein [Xianfuyuplasma coldseepsis]QMS85208.1 ABC transporter ATP-binding protein [Xianfuyuplasma coldseepsis]
MSVIELKNVTKTFGDVVAMDEVSFTVEEGTVYGFIGPNGAGKTTTIRVILGVLKADQGDTTVFGKHAWEDAVTIHKNIAYVPGEVNLWPNLTGGEVIDFFAKLKGGISEEKRDELYHKFDLDPTKKCRTYSKGNRQKVALVAALASDADVFILDEPTSGLDPLMERVFQEYVTELKKQKKTIFLSSHILSEVEKLCDVISIIREGQIVQTGTLDEMRHLTRNFITAETSKPITDLAKQDGVYNVQTEGSTTSFELDSSKFGDVLKYISSYDVIKLDSRPPTLEDLFMRHYEK